MNELSYNYNDRRGPVFLANLGRTLSAHLQGNSLQVPPAMGTGRVLHLEPVKGFHLYVWGIQLLQPLQLQFEPSEHDVIKAVQLTALLTPAAAEVSVDLPELLPETPGLPSGTKLCLLSDGVFPSITIKAGYPLRYLELSMPVDWLVRELTRTDVRTMALVNALQKKERVALLSDQLKCDALRTTLDITESLLTKEPDATTVRRAIEDILDILLGSLLAPGKVKKAEMSVYDVRIQKLCQLMDGYRETKLPPLELLASQAGMGISNLARQFRVQVGETPYSYYLRRKMEYAKYLLENGSGSVRETAIKMGFTSLPQFSTIFKKYMGYKPSHFLKSRDT